ncbi:MAG: deoxyribonuclease IV [Mycoplasmoidaceae bacterium]|nr:deoxyribonuclease IV [Mycoplasmoidaceae bacterium]
MNKLGCHVSMSAPDYLLGSLDMATSQDANCFMIYTGSPQSIARQPISKLKVKEFHQALKEKHIPIEDVIVHSPYIINCANSEEKKRHFAKVFLAQEVDRVNQIGAKYLVLHPGSNPDKTLGCKYIAEAINFVNKKNNHVIICLETMAGKGNEIGSKFEELKEIIKQVENKNLVGVCLDTCHISDSGYEITDPSATLKVFDDIIGLKYLKVIHVNDSLNEKGAHKDRHANIGEGKIGLKTLKAWVNYPLVSKICKILETPWTIDGPIYKKEIHMLLGK